MSLSPRPEDLVIVPTSEGGTHGEPTDSEEEEDAAAPRRGPRTAGRARAERLRVPRAGGEHGREGRAPDCRHVGQLVHFSHFVDVVHAVLDLFVELVLDLQVIVHVGYGRDTFIEREHHQPWKLRPASTPWARTST